MKMLGITEQLSDYIIRPPRFQYNMEDLGQQIFNYKSRRYNRIDFQVPASAESPSLQGCLYTATEVQEQERPTVIYLHSNSSCRVSVKPYLKFLIQHFDVVAFDFRGCGISQGKYLTLGYLEKYDLQAVISFVEINFGKRKFMLWGRSMGAVTAITYTAQLGLDKISCLVVDSPFADLESIIHHFAEKKATLLPSFLVESVISDLQQQVSSKIHKQYGKQFLIRQHKPIREISKIKVPIFFIGSKNDELVDPKNLQKLYDNCKCERQMELLEGGHNQQRPDHLKLAVVQFLIASLGARRRQPILRRRIFGYTPRHSMSQLELQMEEPQEDKIQNLQKNRIFGVAPQQARQQMSEKLYIPLVDTQNRQKKTSRKSNRIFSTSQRNF